jgi:hypothetical protein
MYRADRRQEWERLHATLIDVRDKLDDLIGHLEEGVLPPRMIAASAQQLMSAAMTSTGREAEPEARDAYGRWR